MLSHKVANKDLTHFNSNNNNDSREWIERPEDEAGCENKPINR